MSDSSSFGYGFQDPNTANDDFTTISFLVRQLVAELSTTKLVQVVAMSGGGVAPAGTVDVLPLVSQVDGNGNATPHGTVTGLPWSRVQGGKNAIICDPQVGDIGYVVACDRDISGVVRSGKQSTPGSSREFDISDGIYAGGCLNVAPNQYLIFTTSGVRLVDSFGNSIAMTATGMTLADCNANQIVMEAGSVNIITPVLKVNGVPVTVP